MSRDGVDVDKLSALLSETGQRISHGLVVAAARMKAANAPLAEREAVADASEALEDLLADIAGCFPD